jgi:hypothetical protein
MDEQRWDDERANHLLDAARVVLEAAGVLRSKKVLNKRIAILHVPCLLPPFAVVGSSKHAQVLPSLRSSPGSVKLQYGRTLPRSISLELPFVPVVEAHTAEHIGDHQFGLAPHLGYAQTQSLDPENEGG